MPSPLIPTPTLLLLLALLTGLQPAHAEPARAPRQLIEGLGVQVRKILQNDKPSKTPEDAERAVAEQITELIRSSPGHLSLTDADMRGQTPLMLAASGAYPLVVQALLADPAVRLQINVPNEAGETAWMLARFAPSLTLVACQPGALTIERALFLPPYLRRMAQLLKSPGAGIQPIIDSLEAAGAEPQPEAAKRAWLARCHNASPELRQALVNGELTTTLIKESLARQRDFNTALRDRPTSIPEQPPEGMKFTRVQGAAPVLPLTELLRLQGVHCVYMAKPPVPQLNWTGLISFKVTVTNRAGIVETADFEVVSPGKEKPYVVDAFRRSVLAALAQYECEGDQAFEQEFTYRVD